MRSVTLEYYYPGNPVITSIFPNFQHALFGPNLTLNVPAGFSNRIITCNVFGWPPPIIEWFVPSASDGSISRTTENSVYFSAALEFSEGFQQSDSGLYFCLVHLQSVMLQSKAITLQYTRDLNATKQLQPGSCEVDSTTASFQFRVLTIDCFRWSEVTKGFILTEMEHVLIGGILFQCQNCSINLTVERPSCSMFKRGASIFRGVISDGNLTVVQATFCALRSWWELQPQVRINEDFWPVDPSCMMSVNSSNSEECSTETPIIDTGSSIGIVSSSTSVSLVFFLTLSIVINIGMIFLIRKRYAVYLIHFAHV